MNTFPKSQSVPFIEDATKAAEAVLSCMKQDMAFTGALIDRYGILALPGDLNPLFRVLMEEWREGRGWDAVRVERKMRRMGLVNGAELKSILPIISVHHPLNSAEYYCQLLAESQAMRLAYEAGEEMMRRASERRPDLAGLVAYAKERIELIGAAPGARQLTELPEWVDGLDFVINKPTPPQELIAGVLHRGAKLVLGGSSKSNKTWSLLDMAVSVATGHDWWGQQTARGRVLYLNLEIAAPFFAKRLHAVLEAKDVAIDKGDLTAWNLRGHSCDIGRLSEQILPSIKEGDFSLIVLDPIYKCLGNRDENKAGEIASLMNQIERIAVECNAAVAFGAHYSKGNQAGKESIDRIGGSGVFARDPDAILTLTRHEEDNAFVCEPILRNHAPCPPFVVRWEYPLMRRDDEADASKLKEAKPGRKKKHSVESIMDVLREMNEATTTEWQKKCYDELGMPRTSFYEYKDQAFRERRLHKSKMTEKWMPK